MERIDKNELPTEMYELKTIKAIRTKEGTIPMVDIEVESEHTFLMSKENIVSHNCNNMMKGLLMPALMSQTAMIVTNHVYDDPASMFPSKIKNQGGGKGIIYANHVALQLTKKLEKADKAKDDVESFYKGNFLKFCTVKNRIVKPFYESEMYIDFDKGISKYDGLFEPAIKYGLITNPKQGYYQVPEHSDKMFRRSQLIGGKQADEVWGKILDKFEAISQKDMQYSNVNDIDELNEHIPEEIAEELNIEEVE